MPAKILLVEDDNNLREIYEARLQAEGYNIVTARDGEEALVVAKAEKPDLIISDVMMPRISGFEMLDILRNTSELKDTRVIMLTALGQADDQTRANSLGADRYLVKSQVTLEDIVKAAHELIEGAAPEAPVAPQPSVEPPLQAASPAPLAVAAPPVVMPPTSAAPAAPEVHVPDPAPVPPAPVVPQTPPIIPPRPATPQPPAIPSAPPTAPAAPASPVMPEATPQVPVPPTPPPTIPTPEPPLPTPAPATSPDDPAGASTMAEEQAAMHTQIEDFINHNLTHPDSSAKPAASSDTASDDALLAGAVKDLNGSAPTVMPPASPAQPQPALAIPSATPAATLPQAPAAPAPTPPTPEPPKIIANNSVTIANKKVIQPLKSDPKPGLNELLAREEAKEIVTSQAPVVMPPEPPVSEPQPDTADTATPAPLPPAGNVFMPSSPSAAEAPSAPAAPPTPPLSNTGPDPNNIAL